MLPQQKIPNFCRQHEPLMQRRSFLTRTLLGAASLTTSGIMAHRLVPSENSLPRIKRKYRLSLKADAIGVAGPVPNLLETAANLGFESIAMPSDQIVGFGERELNTLKQKAEELGLSWGSAGLPLQFRNSKEEYDRGMGQLPQHARAMAALGITRVGTWIMPCNDDRSYAENMDFHAERLRPAAQVLADHGVRLGLEYVGPRTLRDAKKYVFVVNGQQLGELMAAIDVPSVGVILDSFHWYCAEESAADLQRWRNEDIVAVDVNDADRTLGPREQMDGNRELPGATGKIDIATFMRFLVDVGYDGPVRAEPFNATLNAMDDGLAMRATLDALQKLTGE